MFESFKSRKEEISEIGFENLKMEDVEMQTLALEVTSKMSWETEEGEESAVAFVPQEGYEEALKNLQKYLDNKGFRYSENALATVLAKIMDVGGFGYEDVM